MGHSIMRMDREEAIGLGASIGLHALIIALLLLGLLAYSRPLPVPPPAMTVSIIGPDGENAAPDPVLEEPASAASAPAPAAVEEEMAEPEPIEAAEPIAKPEPEPILKPVTQPITKPALKPAKVPPRVVTPVKPTKPVQKTAVKPVQKTPAKIANKPASKSSSTAAKPAKKTGSGLGSAFDAAIAGIGKSQSQTKSKTGAGTGSKAGNLGTKSAAQIKTAVNVSLRNDIQPFFKKCAPSGVDVDSIVTSVVLNIGQDKRLISVSFNGQRGVNDSNRPQAGPHKDCVIRAVKAASPYPSLPNEGYDQWRSWPMEFKIR